MIDDYTNPNSPNECISRGTSHIEFQQKSEFFGHNFQYFSTTLSVHEPTVKIKTNIYFLNNFEYLGRI